MYYTVIKVVGFTHLRAFTLNYKADVKKGYIYIRK